MDMFDELTKAINEGDTELVEKIKRKILMAGRDESLDESLILNIKDKPLGKNLKKLAEGKKEFSNTECIKIISSMLTHNVIESEVSGNKISDYPIHELYVLLGRLISGEGNINECREFIKERYEKFLCG